MGSGIHTDERPEPPKPEERRRVPTPDHHDGDDVEWVALPDASVSLEAHGIRITAYASGETAVHDAEKLLDAAVQAIEKLRHQVQ